MSFNIRDSIIYDGVRMLSVEVKYPSHGVCALCCLNINSKGKFAGLCGNKYGVPKCTTGYAFITRESYKALSSEMRRKLQTNEP